MIEGTWRRICSVSRTYYHGHVSSWLKCIKDKSPVQIAELKNWATMF